MKNILELEFYYDSTKIDHLRTLNTILETLKEFNTTKVIFRPFDLNSPFVAPQDQISGFPCLRRIQPRPERQIFGPLKTTDDIMVLLGVVKPIAPETDLSSSLAIRT
jgi:hypothetical protein